MRSTNVVVLGESNEVSQRAMGVVDSEVFDSDLRVARAKEQ
jgi:hypothetical protein